MKMSEPGLAAPRSWNIKHEFQTVFIKAKRTVGLPRATLRYRECVTCQVNIPLIWSEKRTPPLVRRKMEGVEC